MSEDLIRDCIRALLSDDPDAARERNGVGPNRIDGPFFRSLIAQPAWTHNQALSAWTVLQKYAGQLPVIATIPQPAAPAPASAPAPVKTTTDQSRKIDWDGRVFIVGFPYNPPLVAAIREIAGRKWDAENRTWTVPAGSVCALRAFARRYNFTLSLAAEGVIAEKVAKSETLTQISASKEDAFTVEGLGGTLKPYQAAGVRYMVTAERCLNGDEPGLGKTIQTLAAIESVKAYPAIIVCPALLKVNWQREAQKWIPERTSVILSGRAAEELPVADIYIVNYDILSAWVDALKKKNAQSITLDESHYCKSHTAGRTKAAAALARKIRYRFLLSGTPIINRPQEIISQLSILGRLEEFGGFWGFAHRFCDAKQTRFGMDMTGAANLEELNDRMRGVCYVRRRKEDVLAELPAVQRSIIYVEPSNAAEYTRAENNLLQWIARTEQERAEKDAAIAAIEDDTERKAVILERSNASVEKAQNAEQLVRIEKLKQLAFQGKMKAAVEWIENFLASGEKLIVFAHHQEAVNLIAATFNAPSITGATSSTSRQAAIDRFQSDPTCNLIALNMQAGGVGITLTAASNVLFLEVGWNPAIHDQAESRAHRIGQKGSVMAWYMLASATIDEETWALVEQKRQVVTEATDGQDARSLLERMKARRSV